MFSRNNDVIHFLAHKIFEKLEMVFLNYIWLHFDDFLLLLMSLTGGHYIEKTSQSNLYNHHPNIIFKNILNFELSDLFKIDVI